MPTRQTDFQQIKHRMRSTWIVGETVLGVLALTSAAGASLPDAAVLANTAAGVVVGKLGTASVTPDEPARALADLRR